MCERDEVKIKRLNNKVSELQQEKLHLLRDWSESQNVFVKSVRKLEIQVSERDQRIRDLLGIKKEDYCVCDTTVPSKTGPFCRVCNKDIEEYVSRWGVD